MAPARTLRVASGPVAGTSVEVERELIIGREAADLTIPDREVSRRHAAVRPVETGVVVEDLGSLNGTFVDGERIGGPVTLTADATIRVGRSAITLQVAIPGAAPEPEDHADDPGGTRLAATLPPATIAPVPSPEQAPAAQAAVTASQAAEAPLQAEPQEPPPIAQPGVTRVRAIPRGGGAGLDTAAGGDPRAPRDR